MILVVKGKRRKINCDALKAIKASISSIGLQTPVTVRKVDGRYVLVAGLHRLLAMKALGFEKIPCRFIYGSKKIARQWEIAENLHRAEVR